MTSIPAHHPAAAVEHLRRYEPLVDDIDALLEACTRPLHRCVWVNPLLAGDHDLAGVITARAPGAEPLSWLPGAWRLPARTRPGNWPEYRLGWLHGQEEAALWAAHALDPRPGQRVLDQCAAPGNKTAQLAVLMGDRGLVVANEKKRERLTSLRHNLDRLGVTSAIVTRADGRHITDELGFDAVLADVPCSCEGTSRKPDGRRWQHDEAYRDSIAQTQKALLRRAIALTRPGGTVVYSTCTFAPEENECVLDAIEPRDAVIEPLVPPAGLVTAPGVTSWQGRRYRPDVAHALRIWPHHNDTGGFFVARLRRLS